MANVLQLEVGGFDKNYSYLVTGKSKNETILIDPTGSVEVIENAIQKNELKVVLILLTHSHPDHKELASHFALTGIKVFEPKKGLVGRAEEISVAEMKIEAIHTPGHTPESVCYLIDKNIFSGDTLFVKGVGTTAYGGNDKELKESLDFLSSFDKKLRLWPGHNYGGTSSTLGTALSNSHIKPSEKTLEEIKKRVEAYEKGKFS